MAFIADVLTGRIYFPPDDKVKPDERAVLHPETNASSVLCEDGTKTLEEVLDDLPVVTRSSEETKKYAGKKNKLVFEIKKEGE